MNHHHNEMRRRIEDCRGRLRRLHRPAQQSATPDKHIEASDVEEGSERPSSLICASDEDEMSEVEAIAR